MRALLVLLASVLLVPAVCLSAGDYRGVIAIDAATGAVLHEDGADVVSPPASVAKLMNFLVVHDALAAGRLRLDTPVTANAADQEMGGTQVHLAAGETIPVEELLHAVMIESANDAAHALCIPAAGSREAFIAAMNARARSLGMTNTVFRTPHGLPPASRQLSDSDLTTARDLALLGRELVSRTDALRYTSVRARLFAAGIRAQPQPMRNHNKLIVSVEGCDGLKTGFTRAAGYCLVATAQRGARRVVVAILGSSTAAARDAVVARLIEEAFAKMPADSVFTGAPTALAPIAQDSAATPVAPVAPLPAEPAAPSEAPAVRFVMPKR